MTEKPNQYTITQPQHTQSLINFCALGQAFEGGDIRQIEKAIALKAKYPYQP